MKKYCLILLSLFVLSFGSAYSQDTVVLRDTIVLLQTDTVFQRYTDTVVLKVIDSSMLRHVQEREALMAEKEKFYKEIFTKSGVDQNKIEADRDHYRHLVDSLNKLVREAELENVRKEEANKYLLQRAKDAEARVAEATNRKKKVRAIQGIAMRFYRTPNWEVRLQPAEEAGTYNKVLRNRRVRLRYGCFCHAMGFDPVFQQRPQICQDRRNQSQDPRTAQVRPGFCLRCGHLCRFWWQQPLQKLLCRAVVPICRLLLFHCGRQHRRV